MRERRRLRDHLTYSNVIATVALFLALTGGAVAASQLAKNSVGPKQLKKNAVTAPKLKKNAVNGAKVQDASLTGADLKDATITTAKVADGAITAAKLGGPLPGPNIIAFGLDEECARVAGTLPAGTTATQTTAGCEITFGFSVLECVATATVGLRTDSVVLLQDRTAQTFRAPSQPSKLFVATFAGGSLNDLPFDLLLVC